MGQMGLHGMGEEGEDVAALLAAGFLLLCECTRSGDNPECR